MTLFATQWSLPLQDEEFRSLHRWTKMLLLLGSSLWVGTKTNNGKNNQKTKQSLNVVISLGSGVTIIPGCHPSVSPVSGNDTQRKQSSVYTKGCRQCSREGAGLRKSLQSNPTLFREQFYSTGWNRQRRIKAAKGSHLTSNLALAAQPRFILEMNRSQRTPSQGECELWRSTNRLPLTYSFPF